MGNTVYTDHIAYLDAKIEQLHDEIFRLTAEIERCNTTQCHITEVQRLTAENAKLRAAAVDSLSAVGQCAEEHVWGDELKRLRAAERLAEAWVNYSAALTEDPSVESIAYKELEAAEQRYRKVTGR